jgi:hypothetical protein
VHEQDLFWIRKAPTEASFLVYLPGGLFNENFALQKVRHVEKWNAPRNTQFDFLKN